jgi:hypothetical protein
LTNQNLVLQSQIYTIKMDAYYLNLNADPGLDVHILVDSQVAIQAIGNTTISYNSVLQARSTLNELGRTIKSPSGGSKPTLHGSTMRQLTKLPKRGPTRGGLPEPGNPHCQPQDGTKARQAHRLDKPMADTNTCETIKILLYSPKPKTK